jgi:hypothetical protein
LFELCLPRGAKRTRGSRQTGFLPANQSQGLERLLSELGFSTGLKTYYRQKIEYFKKAM